jgi:hypothetical protein
LWRAIVILENKKMLKKIGALLATGLGLVLLVYSATRALNFIALTLPPDKQILAWFGLAALDGGLIAWTLAYLHGSRGWQRPIALMMVFVDLVGAVGMFTLDTLYHMGQSGMTQALTQDELQMAALALSGVIALNIAATVAHHLTDPDRMKEQAEEEAFDKVEDATLKQISQNAEQLAAQVAPMLAQDWADRTRARYLANVGKQAPLIVDSTAKDAAPAPLPIAWTQPTHPAPWTGLVMPWAKANGNGKQPQPVNMETDGPGNLVDTASGQPKREGEPGTAPAPFRKV